MGYPEAKPEAATQRNGRHPNRQPPARRAVPNMVVVMAGLVTACTAETSAYNGLEIADSVGIRIVVADGSLHEEDFPAVRLDKVDTIGVGLDQDPYQFTYIRGAVLTRNGILVADQLSREIRYFDWQGLFLASLGGEGEGPGEFKDLTWIQRREDGTLSAWDGTASRLTSIVIGDSTLSVLSTRSLNVVPWEAQPMGVVGVDRLLLVGAGSDRPPLVPGRVNGGEMVVGVASADMLPGMQRLATVPGRPAYFSNDSRIVQVPFTVLPEYVTGTDVVWIGDGGNGVIRKVDTYGGQAKVILRLPSQGLVTEHEIAEFIESDLARHPAEERLQRRRLLNQIPMPKELPAFDRLRLDDGHRLWVGGYSSGSSSFTPWHAFDSGGCPVARVDIPARFRVLAIGYGRMAVRARDRLGVERVLLYQLGPPIPGAEGSGSWTPPPPTLACDPISHSHSETACALFHDDVGCGPRPASRSPDPHPRHPRRNDPVEVAVHALSLDPEARPRPWERKDALVLQEVGVVPADSHNPQ